MQAIKQVEKSKIIAYLLEEKETSYRNMLQNQQADMREAAKTNEESESLFEDGKVDQSINRVEAKSSAVSALLREINLLRGLDSIEANDNIQLGDVIQTNKGNFFVAVPEEAFTIEGITYRGISTDSPLYRALAGKSDGDKVTVNGAEFELISSY